MEFDYSTLDPLDPRTADALLQAYFSRLDAFVRTLTGNAAEPDLPTLQIIFAEALSRLPGFDPAASPSIQSWLYAIALRRTHLNRQRRSHIRALLPQILARPPHLLNLAEIAHVLRAREHRLAPQVGAAVSFPGEADPAGSAPPAGLTPPPDFAAYVRLAARPQRERRSTRERVSARFRQAAMFSLTVAAVFLIFSALNNSIDPDQGSRLFPTPTPPLPSPLAPNITSANLVRAAALSPEFETHIYQREPAMSADGRWVVFSSNNPVLSGALVPGDLPDIYLYDAANGTIRQITNGAATGWYSFVPDISADGSVIVYGTFSENQESGIWLYTPADGQTRRLSDPHDGDTEQESAVFLPQISADGQVVVYWQVGGNLSAGSCDGKVTCANIAWHNRQTGETKIILTGSGFEYSDPSLSVSGDGRLIAFTLARGDGFWARIKSGNNSEAVLYNVETGEVRVLNAVSPEVPGNGDSFTPALSADGKFAAFTSLADNLVPGDTNGIPDIFLVELVTGAITRINVTAEGAQAEVPETERGRTAWFPEWGGNQIALSSDGRYAAFQDSAANLIADSSAAWWQATEEGSEKIALFVHDRLNGETRQVLGFPLSWGGAGDIGYFGSSLGISDDGETLVSVTWLPNPGGECPAAGCTEIILHNRSAGNAVSITAAAVPGEAAGWNYRGSLAAHSGRINTVAVDPAGGLLATGGLDGRVLITSLEDGETIFALQAHDRPVNAAAFAPDGTWLAAGSEDGSVSIWDMGKGTLIQRLENLPGAVRDLAVSPDGRRLAVASLNGVTVWEVEDGGVNLLHNFPHAAQVTSIAISPGGWLAYSVGAETWVRRMEDGGVTARLAGHNRRVLDAAFSPRGDLLATASEDGRVNIWRAAAQGDDLLFEHARTLQHGDWASALAFAPDGTYLAVGSYDSQIYLWQTADWQPAGNLQRASQDQVLSLSIPPDGRTILAGTVNAARLWQYGTATGTARASEFFAVHFSETLDVSGTVLPGLPPMNVIPRLFSSLAEAEAAAPFEIRVPPNLPPGFTLSQVAVYEDGGGFMGAAQVYIRTTSFQPALLTIFQSNANPREFNLPVAPSAVIVAIEDPDYFAEWVEGGWGAWESELINGVWSISARTWNESAASYWLRAAGGEWYFSIFYDQPFLRESIPASELLQPEWLFEMMGELLG
jgi:WD40 repeat protein/DNA-directed RNA polymerase specialized sigma24 family protein